MSEVKHTPGPWEISKVANDHDQHMIYSEVENPGQNIVNTVEGEANARLIAKAPELLESVRVLWDALSLILEDSENKIVKAQGCNATEAIKHVAHILPEELIGGRR